MAATAVYKVPEFYTPPSTITSNGGIQEKPALNLPTISFLDENLGEAMKIAVKCSLGVFELQDLPVSAPFKSIRGLFERIATDSSLADRANAAYTNNLVYKDAYGQGNGGTNVDHKRVIDLSPARLDTIVAIDHDLASAFGSPLEDAVNFFDQVRNNIAPKILSGLAKMVGDSNLAKDNLVNYRMVDYPSRPCEHVYGPRCGAHRDFGTMTIIFPDGTPGLEVLKDDGTWSLVTCQRPDSAILLFGWCANIRSNDRVPAALHRVRDVSVGDFVPRRTAAVFFLAPGPDVMLDPKLTTKDEPVVYKPVTAGELKKLVGRKWRYREGTLSSALKEMEVEEEKVFPTQDDIISYKYKY